MGFGSFAPFASLRFNLCFQDAGLDMRPMLEVVAAVIQRSDGRFLLARRPDGKPYAGYWEFPGGKVEPGETAPDALRRELREELGIEVGRAYPWLTRRFDYPHALVRLNFFRVADWRGGLHGREGQQLSWQTPEQVTVEPLLPANGPILAALRLPGVYAITNAGELGVEVFLQRLGLALEAGVRLIQVREKSLEGAALGHFAAAVVDLGHARGARVVVNGDVALAEAVRADGVHLPAAQLMAAANRPAVALCGASCHTRTELVHAAELGLDFAVLSPVKPTLSHPDAPALGWMAFAELAAGLPLPVYALGGMVPGDLATAWEYGAHGIAMQRAVWRATLSNEKSSDH